MNNPLAICQEIFGNKSFTDICKFISQCEYDGIELAPFKIADDIRTISEEEIIQLRDTAQNYSLEIIGAHWLLVSPKNMHISTPSDEIRKETRDFFTGLIYFAYRLEAKVLVFGSPTQRSINESWDHESSYQRGVEFFQDMGDIAKQCQITIAFEPLGEQITNFGGNYTDAIQLLKDINHSNVKLHLDVNAMIRDPLSITDQIQATKLEDLAHVHFNDPNNLGPGMGNLDYTPILKEFKEKGYKGYFSVETFDKSTSGEIISQESIKYIKNHYKTI